MCGRPSGGLGILFKKSMANYIKLKKIESRRICWVTINNNNNFSCLLLNIYFPCDNYSNNDVSNQYVDCIDCIESVINVSNCNSFICCGDWNTSFQRNNAQAKYLCDFISRNNFVNSWDHVLSQCEYTYVNHALGHKSIIDHFIVTRNIFDVIEANYVINEPTNPSSHNIVLLSITSFIHDKLFINRVLPNNIHVREPICAWDKASSVNIDQYRHALEYRLSAIDIDMGVFRCSNNKCQSIEHKHSIDRVCLWLITCIEVGWKQYH